MASIESFKSAITGGGARPNQFKVQLGFPAGLGLTGTDSAARAAEFLCESTSLPGSQIGTANVYYRGRMIPLAGDRSFQPWTITVVNDTSFNIYNVFEQWIEKMANVDAIGGVTTPAAYMANAMEVFQLDRNGAPLKHYKFKDAFPVAIDPIQLSFSDNDQIERFSVTFQYTNWVLGDNNASVVAGLV